MEFNPSKSKPIKFCQICESDKLESKLFLGYVPPVNTMPVIDSRANEELSFPLELFRCSQCGHVQIGHEVDPEVLFPYSYPYLSGSTQILKDNFKDLKDNCLEQKLFSEKSLIVDIGSNDGTLLGNFKEAGARVVGIEPSKAYEVATKVGIETINKYFNKASANEIINKYGKASIVTAANVFAHIPDPHEVIENISTLLEEDGVFISESHYLLSLIETIQYDTIYHEHLRYYHLDSLRILFERHNFEIFDCQRIPTHGGSIRVYASKTGKFKIKNSVKQTLIEEKNKGLINGKLLDDFRDRVINTKLSLYSLIKKIKTENNRIYGIGAPSRASTLINYVGIDDGIIDCVMEVSTSHKLNKYIPGTRIPVLDESALYKDQPEYALLLSWHISNDLIKILKNKGYKGKFIVPLPEAIIIE